MTDRQHELQGALEASFRHLGRADRTVAQLRRHLERRGVTPAVIDSAVAELERQGYLDDACYARRFAEDRRRLDGWGAERIADRLRAAGIDGDLVDGALAGWTAADELEAAVGLLRRRLARAPSSSRERERALGLLLRRGYDPELAYDAVRALGRVSPADCA